MKIKDVMEQTGLTDKAIRLYINNGLAAPSIEENYSGRKSIDFSDADVERLKNIALLRKAGFSIADIKNILDDESKTNEIVNKFIYEKEKDIKRDAETVNMLRGVLYNKLTFKILCEALSKTTIEKDVPAEDMQITKKERLLGTVFKGIGIFNLVVSVLAVVGYMIFIIVDHKYLTLDTGWCLACFVSYGGFALVSVLSIWVIRLCKYKSMSINKVIKLCISVVASFVLLVYMSVFSLFATMTDVNECIISETDNSEHYLSFDAININLQGYVEENIQELFPSIIPCYAEEEVYYYRYCDPMNSQQLDVFAEWVLPQPWFDKEVENKLLYKPELVAERYGMDDVLSTSEIGDWKLMYFAGDEDDMEETDIFFVSAFAYNEKMNKVRYIISYSWRGSREPYFRSLEW
ncbi:MAG: MerR family transcriptional regulator [Clostridia bacterium]|nr:MerR family transcriptional regulator [Clostridia bacterium]